MSWEETYHYDRPCYCGKGTITLIGRENDWFQHEEDTIINCPECRERQRIAEMKQRKIIKEKSTTLKNYVLVINEYFTKNFNEQWITYFANIKNKKQAWELAKKVGLEDGSLSSFYYYHKGQSLEEYIQKLAKASNMPNIIKALNIDDQYFEETVNRFVKLKDEPPIIYFVE
ncbi:hypothetical protein [Sporolactobacillus terrae]|uniref:hypothetical protein n=1 Tax=Sporolactobacillus terrae TaxID=269673 RepID=UPI001CBF13BF|nr:hypothetical protein [Sporolactobacillus terrae]UAK18099.1 hypothetical protein K7399_16045 [Sporolactobacillus terrae]